MREFLKGLELDKETIDTIMAEYGKNVQGLREQVDEYKEKLQECQEQIREFTDKEKTNAEKLEEYETLKNAMAEEKNKKDDEVLTNNIVQLFGNRKFTSEYAKQGLISDIKTQLKKEENAGKGIKDIYEELTKNSTDIFANPNQVQDMEPMGDMDTTVSKEEFDKMSYKQRVELKAENPELFAKYNN